MLKPLTHEEAQRFLNDSTPERPEKNTRVISITITGPEAGPIAAGVTTALAKVAQSIESRHKNTGVRVVAARAVEALADTVAKTRK